MMNRERLRGAAAPPFICKSGHDRRMGG